LKTERVPLILDTHYVYAIVGAPGRLSRNETRFLAQSRERFVVSAVSIWEIRIKWNSLHPSGARKGPQSADQVLDLLTRRPIDFLDLKPHHAAVTLLQPLAHSDPFDELLLAQAQAEGVRLLTRDARLASHPLARTIG
jgi:PIN domain nuclease of toxin-antitoxin system